MSDQMAADHRRDHAIQRLFDDARRAIDAALTDDAANRRLSPAAREKLLGARSELVAASRHITAVWD